MIEENEKYEEPKMEIIECAVVDVHTTSLPDSELGVEWSGDWGGNNPWG